MENTTSEDESRKNILAAGDHGSDGSLNAYFSAINYDPEQIIDIKKYEPKIELVPFNRYVGSNKGKRKKATNITPPKKKRKKN